MSAGDVVIGGGAVWSSGGSFLPEASVRIRAGRIETVKVGGDVIVGEGETFIDAAGRFVLPGLIDADFHLVSRSKEIVDEELVASGLLEGVINARERLRGGVTAVRDAGCRHLGVFALRRAIDLGLVPGPRAYLAGRNPTGPGAPAHWRNVVVDSAAAARAAVDAELDAGADWVKCVLAHAPDPADWSRVEVYLDVPVLAAAVERAHERGVRIGVHCEGLEVARSAVGCGVDALDHAPLLDDDTVAEMSARGTVYVPTLWAFSADAGLDLAAMGPERWRAVERWRDEHRASVARAAAAGVTIAAGSDAVDSLVRADILVEELRALSSCGLSPAEVLAAATSGAAAAIGDPSLDGTLSAGSTADLIVVDDDPLRSGWSVLAAPRVVVSGGGVVLGPEGVVYPSTPELMELASHFAGSTDRWAHERVVA